MFRKTPKKGQNSDDPTRSPQAQQPPTVSLSRSAEEALHSSFPSGLKSPHTPKTPSTASSVVSLDQQQKLALMIPDRQQQQQQRQQPTQNRSRSSSLSAQRTQGNRVNAASRNTAGVKPSSASSVTAPTTNASNPEPVSLIRTSTTGTVLATPTRQQRPKLKSDAGDSTVRRESAGPLRRPNGVNGTNPVAPTTPKQLRTKSGDGLTRPNLMAPATPTTPTASRAQNNANQTALRGRTAQRDAPLASRSASAKRPQDQPTLLKKAPVVASRGASIPRNTKMTAASRPVANNSNNNNNNNNNNNVARRPQVNNTANKSKVALKIRPTISSGGFVDISSTWMMVNAMAAKLQALVRAYLIRKKFLNILDYVHAGKGTWNPALTLWALGCGGYQEDTTTITTTTATTTTTNTTSTASSSNTGRAVIPVNEYPYV